jgi:hypothetical protein
MQRRPARPAKFSKVAAAEMNPGVAWIDLDKNRRGARERLDRKPARPSQTGDGECAAAARHPRFDTLDAYRSFVDEIVGRRYARNATRLDLERPALQALPACRTTDYEETIVTGP